VNAFGGARLLEAELKASFLDRGVKLRFLEPYVGKPGLSLAVTGTAWRTSQLAYDSETYGGRVTLAYRHETRLGLGRPPVRYNFQLGYIRETLRYGLQASALNDLSSRDERIALGLDPTTGRGAGTLGAFDLDADRTVVDNLVDPHRGLALAAHVEHATPVLLGTYRYTEFKLEARGYVPLGPLVLAARARFGTVNGGPPADVPFSKLYFLGGSQSVRGWGRFQISPLDSNGLPTGGRTLGEGSVELRVPMSPKISLVAFFDAGDVAAASLAFRDLHPRTDAGIGFRYGTPIGVVRADLAFQLNRLPGLFVSGHPETRHWRVHFSIGQAF
jgi:outer membrane protein assembly factor BamA